MEQECKLDAEPELECQDSAAYVRERHTYLFMLALGVIGVVGALFAAATQLSPPPGKRPAPQPVAVSQPPSPAPVPAPQPVVVTQIKAPQGGPVATGQKMTVVQTNGMVVTGSANATASAPPRTTARNRVVVAQPPRPQAQPASKATPDNGDF